MFGRRKERSAWAHFSARTRLTASCVTMHAGVYDTSSAWWKVWAQGWLASGRPDNSLTLNGARLLLAFGKRRSLRRHAWTWKDRTLPCPRLVA